MTNKNMFKRPVLERHQRLKWFFARKNQRTGDSRRLYKDQAANKKAFKEFIKAQNNDTLPRDLYDILHKRTNKTSLKLEWIRLGRNFYGEKPVTRCLPETYMYKVLSEARSLHFFQNPEMIGTLSPFTPQLKGAFTHALKYGYPVSMEMACRVYPKAVLFLEKQKQHHFFRTFLTLPL